MNLQSILEIQKSLYHLYIKTPIKIRLYGIDCPEKGQAFGKRAKQFTSKMVFKKQVEIKPVTKDRYGRTIAWVYVGGKSLCEELLKAGLAWHYKKYSTDQVLAVSEMKARQEKLGLWADPKPIAPWDYRSNHRKIKSTRKVDMVDQYRIEVAYTINKNWAHEDQHRPGLRENKMTNIAFKIMPDGRIQDIVYVDRSGNLALDKSAYKAIVASSPVKPHPDGLKQPYVEMGLRFTDAGVR